MGSAPQTWRALLTPALLMNACLSCGRRGWVRDGWGHALAAVQGAACTDRRSRGGRAGGRGASRWACRALLTMRGAPAAPATCVRWFSAPFSFCLCSHASSLDARQHRSGVPAGGSWEPAQLSSNAPGISEPWPWCPAGWCGCKGCGGRWASRRGGGQAAASVIVLFKLHCGIHKSACFLPGACAAPRGRSPATLPKHLAPSSANSASQQYSVRREVDCRGGNPPEASCGRRRPSQTLAMYPTESSEVGELS
jgi:hypothetical protein